MNQQNNANQTNQNNNNLTGYNYGNPERFLRSDGKHPLHHPYCFWFLKKTSQTTNDHATYLNSFLQVGPFDTIEDFWSIYSYLKHPADVNYAFMYHCFRADVEPTWEHPQNSGGGRWIVKLKKGHGSKAFENALISMISDEFNLGDELCGIVLSVKKYGEDSLAFWNKTASSEMANKLKEVIRRTLNVNSSALEYKPHDQQLKLVTEKDENDEDECDNVILDDEQ